MKIKSLEIGDLIAEKPIIQGGMGVGISLDRLASAVMKEGGIGVLSGAQIGFLEPDFYHNTVEANVRALKNYVRKVRETAGSGILGVNLMVAMQNYERYVREAVRAGVDLIISGAGLPVHLPKYVEDSGTKIAPIVSSLKSVQVICKLWDRKYHTAPDLVIIEGPKAGGHLGFRMEELENMGEINYDLEIVNIIEYVRSVEKKYGKKIPVVVAGGIYDRKDMKKALLLGADGVQAATRFVTTRECDAAKEYKDAYIRAGKEDIILVKSPVGMPGRAIRNQFIGKISEKKQGVEKCYRCISTCNPNTTPYCITEALIQAVTGNIEEGLIFCGVNAWRSEDVYKRQEQFFRIWRA